MSEIKETSEVNFYISQEKTETVTIDLDKDIRIKAEEAEKLLIECDKKITRYICSKNGLFDHSVIYDDFKMLNDEIEKIVQSAGSNALWLNDFFRETVLNYYGGDIGRIDITKSIEIRQRIIRNIIPRIINDKRQCIYNLLPYIQKVKLVVDTITGDQCDTNFDIKKINKKIKSYNKVEYITEGKHIAVSNRFKVFQVIIGIITLMFSTYFLIAAIRNTDDKIMKAGCVVFYVGFVIGFFKIISVDSHIINPQNCVTKCFCSERNIFYRIWNNLGQVDPEETYARGQIFF